MSEGQRRLYQESLELSATADVIHRESIVLLIHILDLEQHHRVDEPATTDLIAIGVDVVLDPEKGARDRVVPVAGIQLVVGEAIDAFTSELPPRSVTGLGCRLARRGLDVSEDLDALHLDERVDDERGDSAAEARAYFAGPGVRRRGGRRVLENVEVARAAAIAREERVARGAILLVDGAGEADADVLRQLLVVAELPDVGRAARLRLSLPGRGTGPGFRRLSPA